MHALPTVSLVVIALVTPAAAQSTPPAAAAEFISISPNALLSSRLIGVNVRNPLNQDVGTIQDTVFESGQLVGVILSVGNTPDGAERYVAVDPSAISINYDEAAGAWRAVIKASSDQLKAAPDFRYEGKWKR
jgi:hypothetical protein